MKKHLRLGILIVTICSLIACQEGLSISSSGNDVSSSSTTTSSISDISSSSSSANTYYPIGPTSSVDVFATDISFSLDSPKISKEAAEDLVNNDISKYPEEKSSKVRTSISSKKSESHVTVNRTTATYSVKDLVEEKHSMRMVDADKKWTYTKSTELTKTTYFVEDDLIRHITNESMIYAKDDCVYYVYAKESYYEGMENKGAFEAYFIKRDDMAEEDYIYNFDINLDGWTYFNETQKLGKIEKTIYNNFSSSSTFYYSRNYKDMERTPSFEYYSSGKAGCFGCIVSDNYDYTLTNDDDYPSMEKNEISVISYHQDYLINISNYFTYEEDYLTKSVSKKYNGETIRDETIQGRKKIIEECNVFYPDLSKFEEREYASPITR